MKGVFFIIISLFFATASFAQLEKRTWLVGGSASFYSYSREFSTPAFFVRYKVLSMDLAASVGYFPIDKLSVGLRPDMTWVKKHWTQASPGVGGAYGNNFRYKVGPFVRYYFLNMERRFNLLSDICYQFGTNYPTGGRGTYESFFIKGGVEVFFSSTAGVEVLLGYANYKGSSEDLTNIKNGFQVSIGFQLHLIRD
jgi:hypothetical protein